ncbi:MAG: hypothetical protein K2M95_04165, partial [Clostridiales bacterium]|nr:hypothetical protein [Clostridiales bacterium]
FSYDLQSYLVLMPLIVVAGNGLSGAFYVMRRLVWGEGVGVGGHFFRGIKKNILPFLWSSLIMGISLFIVLANIGIYNHMRNIHVAWRVLGIVVSIIQFYFIVSMMLFITTQAVTYKLKTWALIKNSFLFSIALLPQNLIILLLSAIPVLLLVLLPTMIRMFIVGLFIFMGFSYIMLVWTVYAHWAYDRFINDRVEGAVKNRNMYVKSEQDAKAQQERDRKNKNIRFNNPKKRPKKITSIDEGETFTPLPTSFSRADLLRLQEEKEQVKRSIDAEYEDTDEPDSEDGGIDEDTQNAEAAVESASLTENEQTENAAAEAEEPTTGESSEE